EVALGHYTHEKSPVGAAAALATLQVIEEEDLLNHSRHEGARLAKALQSLNYRSIVEVRGLGLLVGIEMAEANTAEAVIYECLSRGLSFKVSSGTVLTLTPPLTISSEELDIAIDILAQSIEAVEARGAK